jgi:cytochrome c-type biogenesis protein CcmF
MVIHPPTLFLGFALTVVPFAYALAGLWLRKYRDWVRPALPWSLFAAAVLGLGILMGGYWAYETLNFGGYWNWDPVENAVYVPWLFLIAAIHTMISFRKSNTALKASVILTVVMYVLILYSTFLTRSGILGEASVHSFTDLGMSGQLLIYMLFFLAISLILMISRWKELPVTAKESSVYSREFWLFIGALLLCLMGFQVIFSTSFPVINRIVELFGGVSNLAPLSPEKYSAAQLWFAIGVAVLSAIGQFFYWKKIDRNKLLRELTVPIVITIFLTIIVTIFGGIQRFEYLLLLAAGLFTIVSNGKVLADVWKANPKLSGGAITHIGVGMMLIGIMFSSGYSRVVSLNNSGLLISRELSEEFNRENLLLFVNETREMAGYKIVYKGERYEPKNGSGYININDVTRLDANRVVAKKDILNDDKVAYNESDTIEIHPENSYYEVQLEDRDGDIYKLYPRIQDNPSMGLAASPSIKRDVTKDLYAHVVNRLSREDVEWNEAEEFEVARGEQFFLNDYVAKVDRLERLSSVEGIDLGARDVAVKAIITVEGENGSYIAEPLFIIKDNMAARIPDEISDLGIRINLLNIFPDKDSLLLSAETRQKDWIILKAMEKPLINILWLGTLVLMAGFIIATIRRYDEFRKMRTKGME